MTTHIDLNQLPKPDVIETLDFETLFARRKESFLNRFPAADRRQWENTLMLKSEPVVKLLEESAYLELLLRSRINNAARSTMLAYAKGSDLDNIGANFNTLRKNNETDDDFRVRIQNKFESLSVAGPTAAYEHYALSAHDKVKDAKAISPRPAEVVVYLLSTEASGEASPDLISAANAAVNDESVRPVGDRVIVESAEIINYQVNAKIFVPASAGGSLLIAAAKNNLTKYVNRHHKIGKDISLSGIYAALHVDSVENVEITSPASDVTINSSQAAYCTAINIDEVAL